MGEMYNEYLGILDKCQFDDTPKTVWASIVVSLLVQMQGEGTNEQRFDVVPSLIRREWETLHANGIILQKPKPSRGKRVAV
jgi:hypothetical protein